MRWIAPAIVYLVAGAGLFRFHSARGALIGFHTAIVASLVIARPNIPIKTLFMSHNFQWTLLSIVLCGRSPVKIMDCSHLFSVTWLRT